MLFDKVFNLFGRRSVAPTVGDLVGSMRSEIGLSIRADSYNETERSFDAVASTDNPVPMFDMRHYEIVDEILTAEGGEFPAEIPMLDSHDRSSVFKVFGNGTNATQRDGKWNLKLNFDDDEDSTRAMNKVAKRFVRDVSIGYQVLECSYITPGTTAEVNGKSYTAGERMLKVCTKWQANEISLTPIGADKDAKIRAAVALAKPIEKRHDELAADLHDAIVDTGLPESEVIQDMANAADMDTTEVNEILEGNAAPTTDQLNGFSAVLEADLSHLV